MAAPSVLLVTDPSYDDEEVCRVVDEAARALPRGAFGVQLRDKERRARAVHASAERLRSVTREHGAWLIINGDAALARTVGADGLHFGVLAWRALGAKALREAYSWISVATHSDAEVADALAAGVDAVLVSPIFEKRLLGGALLHPRGTKAIASARHLIDDAATPRRAVLYALGGVTPENVGACYEAGADGVACIRALLSSRVAADAARSLYDHRC